DIDRNESASAIASLEVDMHRGFVISGEVAEANSGYSVSSAGDVNGDGLDDLIVGAPSVIASRSYVIFGKTNTTAINLSTIANGTGGFIIKSKSENRRDYSGYSVSSAGDVNGDGLDDLIVGAIAASNGGESYVIFGKTDTNVINLGAIVNGTGGFVINSESRKDLNGVSVSSAGDVNGDGLNDLIVGAAHADPTGGKNAGKSYVIFGKTNTTAINLSTIANGTGGFVINGEKAVDESGFSVSCAGDVNGDGLSDLIVGTWEAGKSYVIFGKTDTNVINLSVVVNGTGGFVINGEKVSDWSGFSVSSAGDVNGDGLDDLIAGAYQADPTGGKDAGKSYVIFGKTNTTAINLSTIANGTGGFVINGEKAGDISGFSVSSAGDVNGDGLDDLIVGAQEADPTGGKDAGKSYVIFGKTNTTAINLSTIANGTGGFVINGEKAGDLSGYSVSSAGDVNGDGLDDLIVGAIAADPSNKNKAGKSYVIFGKTDTNAIE
ncbi:MAG: hypothetical protein FE834_04305, partial [Gammaproteobacteria bacterium]|nr:hypothetical protein [Gammaproteobacteria bacterium]